MLAPQDLEALVLVIKRQQNEINELKQRITDLENTPIQIRYRGVGGGDSLTAHDLGGAYHNADTLANLNTKVSDATLDDSSGTCTRTPPTTVFLKDGSVAMTGNLDLASYALLTTNLLLKELDSNFFALKNRADSAYKSLRLLQLKVDDAIGAYCDPKPTWASSASLAVFNQDTTFGNAFMVRGDNCADLQFQLANAKTANTANRCRFLMRLASTSSVVYALGFSVNFDPINHATRTSQIHIEGVDNGSVTDFLQFDGQDMIKPDFAGGGNRYVYVDDNGKICAGAAYP